MATPTSPLIPAERLPELLSSIAEAPDLAAAGEFLIEQLTDAVGAVDVALTADDIAALEAGYTPRVNAGFQ